MADVMMKLGGFSFSIPTAVYQTLEKTRNWTWAKHELIGRRNVNQYTGPGEDTITLSGVVFPGHNGSDARQIQAMEAQADLGLPLLLVTGYGEILGDWVIESITEGQNLHFRDGAPRRQSFTIRLKRDGRNDGI